MRLTVRSLLCTLGATTALATLVTLALPVARAAADEGRNGITLRAPIDAVDCTATPPTITVLGLAIDVSTATFDAEGGDGEGEDGNGGSSGGGGGGDFHTQSDHQEGDDGGGANASGSCTALVAGQLVNVTFASDATPLVATHVKQDGEEDDGVEIKAPLQAVGSTMNTITLLGLVIDVSTAEVDGNDGEGDHVSTDLSQMMPGQLAEVRLDATKLPTLVAAEVDVQIDSIVVLQAPLDAVDCTATPPTITVLGVAIDVSTATFGGGHCEGGGDGNWHADEEDGGNGGGGCAALVPGEFVHVVLTSDATPLVATQVKAGGEDDGVEIKAPLQAFDSTAQTVTLLGLAIDASGAGLDGGGPPIDFTKLTAGQVAEVHLDGTKLPTLVATGLQVTNVGSDIDVEVDDPSGAEINDPSADVSVDVTETVTLRRAGTRGKPSTTTVHLHSNGHGSFHLSGLPAGSAKISVTRVRDGVTMARSHGARLKTNKTQTLRLRLRRTR